MLKKFLVSSKIVAVNYLNLPVFHIQFGRTPGRQLHARKHYHARNQVLSMKDNPQI